MNHSPDEFIRGEIYKKNTEIEDIYQRGDNFITDKEREVIEKIVNRIDKENLDSNKTMRLGAKLYGENGLVGFRKNKLIYYLREINRLDLLKTFVKKPSKGISGVIVVTVLTSPFPEVDGKKQKFSCQWDCHYCPKEPDQPRSYLHDEPSVKRANGNHFDARLQLIDRCMTLYLNGHPIDKIEILILGGTWDSYPIEYRETFIRDLIYAANTFLDRNPRERLSLEEEKVVNETSLHKIIGITIETRPDCITIDNIRHLRKLGCTRVQIGVQHTDDKILKKINRKCYTSDTIKAIRLLKDNCFKIDIHLMTCLPLATPEKDREMFNRVLTDPNLQVDQWKIYPCEITPWTKIKEWYDAGEYKPYSDGELISVIKEVKSKIHPWIRLNRIIRDIPNQYIFGGNKITNLRQVILAEMKNENLTCRCIRCREIGKYRGKEKMNPKLLVRKYHTGGGDEYFISFEEEKTDTIFGFLRLRLPDKNTVNDNKLGFKSLLDMGLVRELHIYGNIIPCDKKNNREHMLRTQHLGLGKRLIRKAEEISWVNGKKGIAIISGIGVRNYYRKLGYLIEIDGEFMVKHFYLDVFFLTLYFYLITIIIMFYIFLMS